MEFTENFVMLLELLSQIYMLYASLMELNDVILHQVWSISKINNKTVFSSQI